MTTLDDHTQPIEDLNEYDRPWPPIEVCMNLLHDNIHTEIGNTRRVTARKASSDHLTKESK